MNGLFNTPVGTMEKGGYYKNRDLTSFISVFPINDPKYLVLTIFNAADNIKAFGLSWLLLNEK